MLKNIAMRVTPVMKGKKTLKKALIQGMMPVSRPFERIALDILGPLPITPRGNKYIAVFTDYPNEKYMHFKMHFKKCISKCIFTMKCILKYIFKVCILKYIFDNTF